ncbi:MAG: hypothetical protein COC10_07520 [Sphingobium sp.]|jgi:hypothetical protein|nr:MAG: hypothetical protein COC10_07520 [Sphingobium sp.]
MPQAIGAALIKIGISKAIAMIAAKVLVQVAIAVGTALLTNALFGPKRPKPSDGQQITRESVGSRKRRFGIVRTGGQLTFEQSINGTLGMVVTLGTGREGTILEHRVNDKKVTLDGSGTVIEESYRGAIHIFTRSGTDDQTAIGQLTAKFPRWTANHRQRGCAHAAIICDPVKQDKFSEVYNGQVPQYNQVRQAAFLYDPRKDSTAGGVGAHRLNDELTWEWSDNAALVIADYVAHPDGYGLGYDTINWAGIAGEADIADEDCLTVTEETIKRWRLWGSYSLSEDERRQVLTDMLKAVDGFCWQGADFKFNLMVGRFIEPDITITDDHIKGMTAKLGPKTQQRTSALKMLYTERAIGYREQESALVAIGDSQVDANTAAQAVEVFYAPHHNQAVRLGKLEAARLSDRWHLDLTLNLFGLNLLGRRFCRVKSDLLGLDAAFMIDGGIKLSIGRDENTVGAQLVEVRATDWDFDAAAEEGTPPIEPDTDDDDNVIVIPAPTGIVLSAIQIDLAGVNGVAIEATWGDAGRPDFSYQARYREVGAATWIMMTVDSDARTARSSLVDSDTDYEVQVRALTISYRSSDWSVAASITPVAAPAALSAPVFLSVVGGVGEATIRFRMPTEPNLSFARLYHNDSADFGTATQLGDDIIGALGEVIEIVDGGLVSGAHYYWARAYSSSAASLLAGPESDTVS